MSVGVARMDNDWSQALAAGAGFGAAGGMIFGLLRMLGRAVSWLVERSDGRLREERARLEAFREFLDGKAKDYRVEIETELAEIKHLATARAEQVGALDAEVAALRRLWLDTRGVLLEVTVELQVHAPQSASLVRARAHLERKFPGFYEAPETELPDDIANAARGLSRGVSQ